MSNHSFSPLSKNAKMNVMRLLLPFLLSFLLCILSFQAVAQDIDTAKPKAPGQSDMSDIPDDFIIEASTFGERCRNDLTMPLYFDCRCMAVKYLDNRIELGKDASPSVIRNRLGDECKSATGIAGKIYKNCLVDFSAAPKHLDPEEYCSCFGNTFAQFFESYPGKMQLSTESSLMGKARLKCQDPEAAFKLYGIR